MPQFSQDWFSNNIPALNQILARVPQKRRFLEIGSFEGMSACWFLQNHLAADGKLVCIDTFQGGADHVVTKFEGVAELCRKNIEEVRKPSQEVEILETTSAKALAELIARGDEFDFVYVDGSHTAPDVMLDACMAFQVLRTNGIMVFDDYMWGLERPILDAPKLALDMFANLYRGKLDIVMINYQLGVVKLI